MVLQVQKAFFRSLAQRGGGSPLRQFQVIVDDDPIVLNGGASIFSFISRVIMPSCPKENIVCLPTPGGKAHVGLGPGYFVDAATLVIEPLQSKGIENLDFVAALYVAATVGPTLASIVRFEGKEKFEVQ